MATWRAKILTLSIAREPGQTRPQVFSDPAAVASLARAVVPDDAREHFGVLLLNAQNKLVAYREVSIGTLSATLVEVREVFTPAFVTPGVAAIVLVHNHPSGETTPSREDIRLTRQLAEAGRLLNIPVHDHVIIGNGSDDYVSMAERGLI